MQNNTPIAKRDLIAVDRVSKERVNVVIQILTPYPVDEGKNYFCHADFKGMKGESFKVGGVDSLQALTLAVHKLKTRFEILQKERYDFLWPENDTPMDSFDFLPEDI